MSKICLFLNLHVVFGNSFCLFWILCRVASSKHLFNFYDLAFWLFSSLPYLEADTSPWMCWDVETSVLQTESQPSQSDSIRLAESWCYVYCKRSSLDTTGIWGGCCDWAPASLQGIIAVVPDPEGSWEMKFLFMLLIKITRYFCIQEKYN